MIQKSGASCVAAILLVLGVLAPPATNGGEGLAPAAGDVAGEAAPAGAKPLAEAKKPPAEAKPPYAVAHDRPLDAREEVVDRADGYTQYRVEFNGIKGDRVPGFLYVPEGAKKAGHPAVLLQYGSGGNKKTNYIVALGQQFVKRGFVVLTIDSPGRGERRGRGGGFFTGGGTFLQYLGDYSRAVDYLVTRPEVDGGRVGYAGISLGAITGITFVAHDPRIKAMASIVGGGNLFGALKGAPIDPDAEKAARRIDPVYHVGLIAPRPLLLLNVTRDQLVPRFFAESLHKAAGENAKKQWVETDHFFNGIDRYKVLETVIDFMEEGLEENAERETRNP